MREMASPNIFSSNFLLINNATQLNVSGRNQSVESEIGRQSTNCQMKDGYEHHYRFGVKDSGFEVLYRWHPLPVWLPPRVQQSSSPLYYQFTSVTSRTVVMHRLGFYLH